MQKLEINEIIRLIDAGKTFEAQAKDGSFTIKIDRYVPYCCTAIHNGSNLRKELSAKIDLDAYKRWYEEDPYTGSFISSMPITLIGNDSRYEYDLNRGPDTCVYSEAWGQKVWKHNLTPKERQVSLKKHSNYYKVTHALIKKIESLFDGCIVYDIHSYNMERWDRKVPLFNIGAEKIDPKFESVVNDWKETLSQVKIENIENESAINDVFYGRGYNLEYISSHFKNTLVLATEVKKVYCNELTGAYYPKIIKSLQQGLKQSISSNANYFSQHFTNWNYNTASKLLGNKIEDAVLKVDKDLHRLLKNFELLAYINPSNHLSEERKFLKNKQSKLPNFKYRPIRVDAYDLKQKLSNIPVQEIADISIRNMYEAVINSYFDKIDLLSTLGTKKFFYNSLLYFGRPNATDIQNAHYLLHLPHVPTEPSRSPQLGSEQVVQTFGETLNQYGFESKIELSSKIISKAMVLNAKKVILVRPDAKFSRGEINALAEHEIGVHMVTTQNSRLQNLKLFGLGLPVNTETQEGLAILSEYLSGNISMKRLQKLALRVIVVDMMCNGADFIECFNYLVHNNHANEEDAFTLVTRIFRGGGFTKDHLYLSGFVKILRFWENGNNLNPLLIGKTSLQFYHTISEMMERDLIKTPQYITQSFIDPKSEHNNEVYEYILSGLK
ncbi:MAG: flavohemoglobin expression-modulating QEGLA motif protein [Salibacteraceae bacterium]